MARSGSAKARLIGPRKRNPEQFPRAEFQYSVVVGWCPQLSAFGDFSAHLIHCNPLKTRAVSLETAVHLQIVALPERDVIIYALLAAVILLVAVTFISSIDFSRTRRH